MKRKNKDISQPKRDITRNSSIGFLIYFQGFYSVEEEIPLYNQDFKNLLPKREPSYIIVNPNDSIEDPKPRRNQSRKGNTKNKSRTSKPKRNSSKKQKGKLDDEIKQEHIEEKDQNKNLFNSKLQNKKNGSQIDQGFNRKMEIVTDSNNLEDFKGDSNFLKGNEIHKIPEIIIDDEFNTGEEFIFDEPLSLQVISTWNPIERNEDFNNLETDIQSKSCLVCGVFVGSPDIHLVSIGKNLNGRKIHLACAFTLNIRIESDYTFDLKDSTIQNLIITDRENNIAEKLFHENFFLDNSQHLATKFYGDCDICGNRDQSLICEICNKGFHYHCGTNSNSYIKVYFDYTHNKDIQDFKQILKAMIPESLKAFFLPLFIENWEEKKWKLFENVQCSEHKENLTSYEEFNSFTNLSYFISFAKKESINLSKFESLYHAQELFSLVSLLNKITTDIKSSLSQNDIRHTEEFEFLSYLEDKIKFTFGNYFPLSLLKKIIPDIYGYNKRIKVVLVAAKLIEKANSGQYVSFHKMNNMYARLNLLKKDKNNETIKDLKSEIMHVKRLLKSRIIRSNLTSSLNTYCNYKILLKKSIPQIKQKFMSVVKFFIFHYKNKPEDGMRMNSLLDSRLLSEIMTEGKSYLKDGNYFINELSHIYFKFKNFKDKLLTTEEYLVNFKIQEYYQEFLEIGINDLECQQLFVKAFFFKEIGKYGSFLTIFDQLLVDNQFESKDFIWEHSNFKRFEFFQDLKIMNVDIISRTINRSYQFLKNIHVFLVKIIRIKENFDDNPIKLTIERFYEFLQNKYEVKKSYYKLTIILKSLIDFQMAPYFIRKLYLTIYFELSNVIDEGILEISLGAFLSMKIQKEIEGKKDLFGKRRNGKSKSQISTKSSKLSKNKGKDIKNLSLGNIVSPSISDKIDDFLKKNIFPISQPPTMLEIQIPSLIFSNFTLKKEILSLEKRKGGNIQFSRVLNCFSELDFELKRELELLKVQIPIQRVEFLEMSRKLKNNSFIISNRIKKMTVYGGRFFNLKIKHLLRMMTANPFVLNVEEYNLLNRLLLNFRI